MSSASNHNVRVLAAPDAQSVSRELVRIGAARDEICRLTPQGLFRLVRLHDVPTPAAIILKQEMLAFGGDAALHARALTGGLETTDVILLGTEQQISEASQRIGTYAEGLSAIGETIAAALCHYATPPAALRCGPYLLPFGQKTYVMGILNLTADSFSGDGLIGDVDRVVQRAAQMLDDGADILDIGGESTRPGAEEVAADEELHRVIPAVRALAARFSVPISVDTTKSAVAREALAAGATIINDISGLRFDPEMAAVVAAAHAPVVVMHIQGTPRTMQHHPQYTDLMTEVCAYLQESTALAMAAGIPRDQVVLDPGFGFGKTIAHNLELLRRLRELTSFGQPILVGTSRKSTIGRVLGDLPPEERREGTAATVAISIANGADIVRVHDVKEMARVAKMTDAITRAFIDE